MTARRRRPRTPRGREAATDRGQLDAAAGALEQRRADLPFHLLIVWLTWAVDTLSRSAEVQLIGDGQEDLDVLLLHHRPARS
jgi:hypothetical protein